MGAAEIFPEGGNVDILLIFFRLLSLQCKLMFTKRFTVSTPQRKCPWKHVLHSHLFWNLFQVELCTNLPQRCTFYHPLQILLNWRINVIIIVNYTQVSLKLIWIINNYVCGPLDSLCWLNKTRFWKLLCELFFTLDYQKCFFS